MANVDLSSSGMKNVQPLRPWGNELAPGDREMRGFDPRTWTPNVHLMVALRLLIRFYQEILLIDLWASLFKPITLQPKQDGGRGAQVVSREV